jgi:hypothetical protein
MVASVQLGDARTARTSPKATAYTVAAAVNGPVCARSASERSARYE